MAGSVRKIMAYLGLVDDEYDDYDELSERSRPTRSPRPTRQDPRDDAQYDDYDRQERYPTRPPERPSRPERDQQAASISRIRPVTQDGTPSEGPGRGPVQPQRPAPAPMASAMVSVVAPQHFSDAKEIGDHIRQNNPVIVNLQQADRDLQRRMIDFCSGIAYALGCEMERVADQVFLLTPTNVTISDEERARLQARGFNRS